MKETEVRLNGWCEGDLRQQGNDSGGYATMLCGKEATVDGGGYAASVESPGTYVTE